MSKYLRVLGPLAFVAAGAAQAQTIPNLPNNTTGQNGSDLVLFVSDATAKEYFTIDTGISLDSILTTAQIVAGGVQTPPALGSINAPTSFSSSVQAALTSFLNTDTVAGDDIEWTLAAGDSNSANLGKTAQLGAYRYLVSSSQNLDGSGTVTRLTNTNVKTAVGATNTAGLWGFFAEVNAAGIPASGVSTTEGWGAGLLGANQPTGNAQFNGGNVTQSAITSGGTNAVQLFLFASQNPTSTAANVYETTNALDLNWTRGGNATLSVAGGAPVPLPAAIWLLGSGLMGLVGIGRRKLAA